MTNPKAINNNLLFSESSSDATIVSIINDKEEKTTKRKPYLFIIPPNECGKWHLINKRITTIGRSNDNSVQVDRNSISREHCRIVVEGRQHFILEDLNSTNGTYVNGKRIKIHQLKNGDRFYLSNNVPVLFEIK